MQDVLSICTDVAYIAPALTDFSIAARVSGEELVGRLDMGLIRCGDDVCSRLKISGLTRRKGESAALTRDCSFLGLLRSNGLSEGPLDGVLVTLLGP